MQIICSPQSKVCKGRFVQAVFHGRINIPCFSRLTFCTLKLGERLPLCGMMELAKSRVESGFGGVRILGVFTAMQEILIPSLFWTQSIGKKDSLLLKLRRNLEATGEKTLYISEQG